MGEKPSLSDAAALLSLFIHKLMADRFPLEYISTSAKETRRIGRELAQRLRPGDCVMLIGELGAGKTTLLQGIAEGLGVKESVLSPSFILVREYKGRIPLYHFDAYRVRNPQELLEIGLDDYVLSEGIVAIEWGDKVKKLLPGCVEIKIEIVAEGHRKITVKSLKV